MAELSLLFPSALAPKIMIFLIFVVVNLGSPIYAGSLTSCSAVKSEYNRQGFDDEVPEYPIPGEHLKFCSSKNGSFEKTCCTPEMEHKLSIQSRQSFDNRLKKLLNPFANLLEKKHKKFDDLFLNLINHSRRSFDEMFRKTYGVLYLQNAYIFTDLYQGLEEYYLKGKKDMQTLMDNFFKQLYQKMFTVYNSQYILKKDYLNCVNSHMEGLKPFGDVPKKLTINIKRSFVAFRTFVQGLVTGASVVRNVLKVNPNLLCLHELMKMTHCTTCAGHLGVKPCLPYCLHVQELCLAYHLPLAEQWASFVGAMEKLGDRLEGPFNIGNQVDPIDYKISSAIMNFQESGHEITEKVFQGCGQPPLGRTTRSTRGELKLESLDFASPSRRGGGGYNSDNDVDANEAIGRLIREIKTKVKNSKEFWSELPSEMCKDARRHGAANCWTGTDLGKYKGSALLNFSKELESDQMGVQIYRLKIITNKLDEAHLGRDVSWIDEELINGDSARRKEPQDDDGSYEGSGSGWISPKAYSPSAAQYPPDDEDGYEEGSGFYPTADEDEMEEGSGGYERPVAPSPGGGNTRSGHGVYDFVPPPQPPQQPPLNPARENPSAAPAGKPMTLTWAIAVYLVPALFSFFGSIGGSIG